MVNQQRPRVTHGSPEEVAQRHEAAQASKRRRAVIFIFFGVGTDFLFLVESGDGVGVDGGGIVLAILSVD